MHQPIRIALTTVAALLAGLLVSNASTSAAGWGRTPSSCCQFFGYGYGRGYHAPIIYGSPQQAYFVGSPAYQASLWGADFQPPQAQLYAPAAAPLSPEFESIEAPFPAPGF